MTVRTNLVKNPRFGLGTTTYWSSKGTQTFGASTEQAYSGTHSLKVSNDTAGSIALWAVYGGDLTGAAPVANADSIPVTAGQVVNVASVWRTVTAENLNAANLKVWWFDAAGALISAVNVTGQGITGTTWFVNFGTVTAPANTAKAAFGVHATTSSAGAGFYLGGLNVEIGTLGGYFSGGDTDTADYDFAWTGAADDSTSTRTRLRRVNRSTNPSAERPSLTGWDRVNANYEVSAEQAKYGARSIKVTSASTSTVTLEQPAANLGTFPLGEQVEASYWVYTPASGITATLRYSSGTQLSASPVALTPNTWTQLTLTGSRFSYANQVTSFDVEVTFNSPAGGTVYYGDGLLLEAVDTAGGLGTYFDGSTVLAGYTNTWAGTQQQSASYQVAGDPPAPPAPAAIAYRATATSKLETAATSLSVAYPAGIQPGDVVVLWLYVTVNTATVTVPAGWNAGRDIRSFGPTEEISNQAKAAVYWHLVDGTEGASTTWGFSTAARAIVIKTAYSGVNPDLPLGRVRIIEPGGTGTAITLDTTHAVSNAWRLSVGMARKTTDPGATFTIDAAGDAERSDETTVGGTSGSRPSLAVYDSNGTLPQGSSSRTITVSAAPTSASQAAWAAELISRQQTGAGPIAFRGASSVQTNASSTVNATVDSSFVQDGDLILAFVNRVQVGGSTTMPSGFSPVQRYLTPGSADTEVYFKIASGEPSTLTWTLTGSGSIYVSVGLVAYSGVNTSSPIGAWGTSENSGVSSTAHLSPTITTRSAESWVVNAITYAGTHSTTNADPLDAERVDAAAGSHPALAIYDSNRAYPVGSTVNRTLTSSSAATGPVLWAFEIQPGVISSEPEASVDFKRRESGVWVPHTAVPKVRVAGAWQEIQPAYWDGDSWVNLP